MRFLIDAQLPPALARWIAEYGQQADHVADLQLADASDREIWDHARKTGAVLVSKDSHFVTLATLDDDGPAVIWIRLGNTRRKALLEWFAPLFPQILSTLEQGEKLIEIE